VIEHLQITWDFLADFSWIADILLKSARKTDILSGKERIDYGGC